MKFVDEYRDPALAKALIARIGETATRRWTIMEVCGGQTHSIVRAGIDELLGAKIDLVHGPGCPVCVTPVAAIDKAHAIAERPGVIFTSFGDMLRVPGSRGDLLACKARGADVRVVYAPIDAVKIARENPEREVVFFAVGFETTAPAAAIAAQHAKRLGVTNFSLLSTHVLVPPVIEAVLRLPGNGIQAFLGPGHVCTVEGLSDYRRLAEEHRVPIVVTGFEPLDILEGIFRVVKQLEEGRHEAENQYSRVVPDRGNESARRLVHEVFEPCDRKWRGLGVIPKSGLALRESHRAWDAEHRFSVASVDARENERCISGQILSGKKKPKDCPAFGTECTPTTPLGATMVSAEGACAAYYAYGRHRTDEARP